MDFMVDQLSASTNGYTVAGPAVLSSTSATARDRIHECLAERPFVVGNWRKRAFDPQWWWTMMR
ncbi:hypothetical protein AN958_12793 [Leucoagaricus sp. SymC.cos]|nr:hypothetical protein AN958_12793 [Leucoagaricus sp. SymC.cos]